MSDSHVPPLVLVADDEVHTTNLLARIFEREGFQVRSVHDGAAALDAAQRLLPDLILLDVQMPVMNGFDVLRLLRSKPLTAGIPTIIVTAKARQPTDVAHGLELGADDFIQKPFDPRELVARAQNKIRSRKLEEALQRRTQELEALLRVGEELNHHTEIGELLTLVPYLVLDLLPGTLAAIYHLSEMGEILQQNVQTKSETNTNNFDHEAVVNRCLRVGAPMFWTEAMPLLDHLPNGMWVPLQHGTTLVGLLLLAAGDNVFDDNHFRLFEGIGRQTALTLRNAQLYAIQADYAQHLEEMVAAKTAELQSAQQLLIRAEKLASIGHLAASIAHEINNPLQPIRVMLDDMLEDVQQGVAIDIRAVQTTQESVERIRRIVSQLLEFAGRRSASTYELQLLDISAVIEGVISLNRKFFEKENTRIVAELTPGLSFYGSKDQLEQVFMNLMLNAKAAMGPGGVLTIRTAQPKEDIMIQFTDTGVGIPEEQLNKIFDPFFSTKPNGTGLGLFVSYGIIQSHHGSIEVNSVVGKGTTFTIRLPAHHETTRR